MAKAKTPASEAQEKAPRAPRKAAAAKAGDALDKQGTGATAPVSSPADQAAAGDGPATPNPPVAPDALQQPGAGVDPDKQVSVLVLRENFFPGMGRFPPDWKPAQTTEQEASVQTVQSPAWGLPEIAEFPAELTLVNNTRNILVVRPLNTRLMQFGTKTVQCPTAEHYEAIGREFEGRALRERWDSETGLQVKHGEDQD